MNYWANVLFADAKTDENAPPELASYFSKLTASVSLIVALAIMVAGSSVMMTLHKINKITPNHTFHR